MAAKRKRRRPVAFKLMPPSPQGLRLMSWWTEGSPYADWDGVIADGSIRSSKTISAIEGFTLWSLKTFEDEDFIVSGKSIGALRRNVVKPWRQLLAAKGIDHVWHRSENWIQVGSNTYHLFGANNESSQDVVQGMTAAGAFFDEVPLMPKSFVDQAIGRCSIEGSKLWFTDNPEGPNHWFKTEFIDKAEEKRLLHLHFTLEDNPSLSEKAKRMYRRMFSGVWYKRFILGLWTLAEGVIYSMFDEDRHVTAIDRDYLYYIAGYDYGTSSVTAFGLYGVYREAGIEKVQKIKEYYWDARKQMRQKTDEEFSQDFKEFLGPIVPVAIYGDPSASSFRLRLRKDGVKYVRNANNDVLRGIRFVSSMLSTDRYHIDPGCVHTIREKSSYSWDVKAQEKGEDKPKKEDDHCSDEERYTIFNHLGLKKAKKAGSTATEAYTGQNNDRRKIRRNRRR